MPFRTSWFQVMVQYLGVRGLMEVKDANLAHLSAIFPRGEMRTTGRCILSVSNLSLYFTLYSVLCLITTINP